MHHLIAFQSRVCLSSWVQMGQVETKQAEPLEWFEVTKRELDLIEVEVTVWVLLKVLFLLVLPAGDWRSPYETNFP